MHIPSNNNHRVQFNSIDNLLTDPYLQESCASFSMRNPLSLGYPTHYSLQSVPSTSGFPPSREASHSVEWYRASLPLLGTEMYHPEEIEKRDSEDKKRNESPSFYNSIFSYQPSNSPSSTNHDEHIENRKSNLSNSEIGLILLFYYLNRLSSSWCTATDGSINTRSSILSFTWFFASYNSWNNSTFKRITKIFIFNQIRCRQENSLY